MISPNLKEKRFAQILISLFACSLFLWIAIWGAVRLPFQADSSLLSYSWSAHDAFKASPDEFLRYFRESTFYPPGYGILLGAAHYFLGRSNFNVLILNLALIALCGYAVYGLGSKGKRFETAPAALVVFLAAPAVAIFARSAGREMGLMSMAACSLWAFGRSDFLRSRLWSVFAGIFIGAGMMFKWTFAVYLIVPGAVFAMMALPDRAGGRKVRLANGGLLALSALVICASWYFGPADLSYIFGASGIDSTPWSRSAVPVFGAPAWLSVFGWAALLSLAPVLKSCKDDPFNVVLISAFIGPCVILAFIPHKEIRYAFPLIPVMAVLIARAASRMIKNTTVIFSFCAAVIMASSIFGFYSIKIKPMAPGVSGDLVAVRDRRCLFAADAFNKQLIHIIKKDNPDPGEPVSVLWNALDLGNEWFSPDRLAAASTAGGQKSINYLMTEPMYYKWFAEQFGQAEYLLVSKSLTRQNPIALRTLLTDFTDHDAWLRDPGFVKRIPEEYRLVSSVEAPCAGQWLLYRLHNSP